MGTEESHDAVPRKRLLLPALILSVFLTVTGVVLIFTLLLDVTSSFNVSIAAASQLGLVANLGGVK
jgi:predicted MFS family arabinose efflux permease